MEKKAGLKDAGRVEVRREGSEIIRGGREKKEICLETEAEGTLKGQAMDGWVLVGLPMINIVKEQMERIENTSGQFPFGGNTNLWRIWR